MKRDNSDTYFTLCFTFGTKKFAWRARALSIVADLNLNEAVLVAQA